MAEKMLLAMGQIADLTDDATLLLIEYHGSPDQQSWLTWHK